MNITAESAPRRIRTTQHGVPSCSSLVVPTMLSCDSHNSSRASTGHPRIPVKTHSPRLYASLIHHAKESPTLHGSNAGGYAVNSVRRQYGGLDGGGKGEPGSIEQASHKTACHAVGRVRLPILPYSHSTR